VSKAISIARHALVGASHIGQRSTFGARGCVLAPLLTACLLTSCSEGKQARPGGGDDSSNWCGAQLGADALEGGRV